MIDLPRFATLGILRIDLLRRTTNLQSSQHMLSNWGPVRQVLAARAKSKTHDRFRSHCRRHKGAQCSCRIPSFPASTAAWPARKVDAQMIESIRMCDPRVTDFVNGSDRWSFTLGPGFKAFTYASLSHVVP